MSAFVVSARKYRPDTFDTVVGQSSITFTLKNAIRTKSLAQAYLFCGPRGVGKTTCARIFAKTINCKNLGQNIEACNECESCKSFNQNRSFNIHELDAASNNSVDDIRNLIEQVRIPPQVSKYSVYIIDEIHMLSQAAFNAFLKTLEEPPGHAIFILATTEKHKIIPTILSRCQIFDFNRIKINDIIGYLENIAKKEKIDFEIEAFTIIAQKADGAMRDALSIFDQIASFTEKKITYQSVIENLNVLDYEYYFQLTDNFLNGDYQSALILFDEILSKGFDPQNIIGGLSRHFRELLVCKAEKTMQLLEVGDSIKKRYTDQSSKCSDDFLFSCLDLCNECDLSIKSSKNHRLHVEISIIKLCNLVQKKKDETVNREEDVLLLSEKIQTEEYKEEINQEATPSEKVEEREAPFDKSGKDALHKKTSSFNDPDSFSIKEALKTLDSEPEVKSSEQEETNGDDVFKAEKDLLLKDFDVSEFLSVWNEFIGSLKKKEPRMYSAMRNQEPNISGGDTISFSFINNTQLQEFKEKIRPLIVAFLKDRLNCSETKIEADIHQDEKQSQAKFLSEVDKLKHMTSKNPVLQKLKQEFNLDFE